MNKQAMVFEKQSKIDMYKFVIGKGVYVQCEVDMNGKTERVVTQYWGGHENSEKKVLLLDLGYKREYMITEAVITLSAGIKLLLTEEYVWDAIKELFPSPQAYEEFVEKYQPELTCELMG